ncbi:hypothetical protein [Pseudomonas sp. NFIX28]|uniref:hypothetical protein n=1 Tax=Pseudomonas sp. NFIX28 TaxID=1566235 RepID=UPI0008958BC5|nr:hypothetical protein [Pseudomonas sp. NFIX28]SDZ27983.1 hypothetical protein SAMN03159453_02977 [Pseudomonas sp. NFIX28]
MSAKKLFEILVGMLAYLLITLPWFLYAVPSMWESRTEAALIVGGFGSMLWICATACIAIYIVQWARP